MAEKQKLTASESFIRFFYRWTPNSIVFAYLLTLIVAVLALIFTDAPLIISKPQYPSLIDAWVQGFWNLLTFSMQMTLIMITGSVVATSPPVRKFLIRISNVPKNAFQAFLLILIVVPVVTWLHWGLGMMVSIQLARQVLAAAHRNGYKLHHGAFCGYVYSFLMMDIGISQAGPIYAAAPNGLRNLVPESVKAAIPEITPLTESVFLWQNITACILLSVLIFIVCWAITPKQDEKIIVAGDNLINEINAQNEPQKIAKIKATSPAEWIDNSMVLTLIIGVAGAIWIIKFAASGGLANLSLNSFNFIMLFIGLLLTGSPNQFIKSVQNAVGGTWGVIIQFPLYAGIFGIIVYTGLSDVIVRFFMAISSEKTFTWICYIYSAILNMAVPSGGSKFVIEAPYILDVATKLKLDIGPILLAYTSGDCTTNIIQPFWALPFLAMFKLEFKHILPYTAIACVGGLILYSIFFLFLY
jgi:short-chain fatty acids transporter